MEKRNFKYIVRVMNTDLDGTKNLIRSLTMIKGVSFGLANAVCKITGIEGTRKTGELDDTDVQKLNKVLGNQGNFPEWMLNRRNDPATGESRHLITTDINFVKEMDVRIMKKIKTYRGMRHAFGLPVRGQRTRSNFRRNKGKSLGVVKSKQMPKASERKG